MKVIKSIVIDHALLHASNMQLASHTFGSKIFRQHQPYSMIIDDPNFIVLSKAGAFNPQEPLSAILSLRGGSSALSNFSDFIGASKTRCWFVLMFAIILDTVSTTLLKMAKDANSIPKLVAAYFGYALSLSCFGLCLGGIDVTIAYAVWAALGTAIVSAAGIFIFGESCDAFKVCCLLMIVLGVVGLNLIEDH